MSDYFMRIDYFHPLQKKSFMILNLRTLIFSFLFISGTLAQTVPSPDEFLGYPLGTRFTLHYNLRRPPVAGDLYFKPRKYFITGIHPAE
jgi:hypothetical protein